MNYLLVIFCLIFYLPSNVLSFNWVSCGKDSYPIKITEFNVTTYHNEALLISGKGKVSEEITFPLKAKLKIGKKLPWGWTRIPCVDHLGSCEYVDICTLSRHLDTDCPKEFETNKIPCKCPIQEGQYTVKNFPINLKLLPNFIQKGEYKVKIYLEHKKKGALCIIFEFKI